MFGGSTFTDQGGQEPQSTSVIIRTGVSLFQIGLNTGSFSKRLAIQTHRLHPNKSLPELTWCSLIGATTSEMEIQMGLKSDELVTLSNDVFELWKTIQEIKSASSAGGKKITKAEGRKLLKAVVQLAAKIAIDVVD